MKFKKAVSAFAALTMAISVFASLGVTANAETTSKATVSFTATNRITNNGDGTFTTAGNAGNAYALALADISSASIENLNIASSVTVEFDSTIAKGSRFLIGIGSSSRGTNANGSSKTSYNTDGLIMSFGTDDGDNYKVNGTAKEGFDKSVHTTLTLNRETDTYSYTMVSEDETIASGSDISTTVDNIGVIEAYSWLNSTSITLSDVSITAIIPDVAVYDVTINTSPYATITDSKSSAIMADASGKAVFSDIDGAVNTYTISKSGYTTTEAFSVTFDSTKEIDKPLTPTNKNVVYYEDFTGVSEGSYNVTQIATNTVQGSAWGFGASNKLATKIENTLYVYCGNGDRTVTKTFGESGIGISDKYIIEYDTTNGISSGTPSGNGVGFKFTNEAGTVLCVRIAGFEATKNEGASVSIDGYTGDTFTIPLGKTVHVKALIDGTKATITLSADGMEDKVVTATTVGGNITGLAVSNGTRQYSTLDNFVVTKAPIISAVSINSVGSTGATEVANLTEGYEVTAADTKADTTTTFKTDGMTTTTVYIKVDNAVDNVMPAVTFDGVSYTPKYTYKANGGSYYVYQFIDTKGAEAVTLVTYPNAVDYIVE